jgi:hypothetical protein
MYPWPLGEFDNVMDVALDIAMDYLDRTGQAVRFNDAQSTAAMAIAVAWKVGVRHRIKLAHVAIKAVESKATERRMGATMMEYRDIEYTVVQGIERRVWKWSASVEGAKVMGNEQTRSAAVAAAKNAIDRAVAQKKVRLVPPGGTNIP